LFLFLDQYLALHLMHGHFYFQLGKSNNYLELFS
jgi:hypothetical protein